MDGNVGLFASKAVPAALIERIGADVVAVSDDKAVEDKLNATAQTPARGGAKEFVASITAQRKQIATIVKMLGIQPNSIDQRATPARLCQLGASAGDVVKW